MAACRQGITVRSNLRSNVIVLGSVPEEKGPWKERSLTLVPLALEQVTDEDLLFARGILISEPLRSFTITRRFFERVFSRSCEFGLSTVAISTDSSFNEKFIEWRNDSFKRSESEEEVEGSFEEWGHAIASLAEAAEWFARHDAGQAPAKVEIEVLGGGLDEHTRHLLRRAFSDCVHLAVMPIDGGRTARGVYRVFASLKDAESGPHPMPFLVKIGAPKNIREEMENYRHRAEPFIPFHLRPALNERRSIVTPKAGALVCNFIEGGAGLREVLRNGQGACAIFSLFEVTLRALRGHAFNSDPRPLIVSSFLKGRLKLNEISAMRRRIAARDFKVTRTPEQICDALLTLAEPLVSYSGVYHGDPHAGNVLVRQRDAILIDFGSMRQDGPITADPAILEASLIFATDEFEAATDFAKWRKFVDEVYRNDPPFGRPHVGPDHMQFAWIRRAVREVRHVVTCCGASPVESMIVLCGVLLRAARGAGFPKRHRLHILAEKKRAYALAVANRLCVKLEADAKKCRRLNA